MVMQVCFGFSGVDGWSLKKNVKRKAIKNNGFGCIVMKMESFVVLFLSFN